jgi:hypothetical protein
MTSIKSFWWGLGLALVCLAGVALSACDQGPVAEGANEAALSIGYGPEGDDCKADTNPAGCVDCNVDGNRTECMECGCSGLDCLPCCRTTACTVLNGPAAYHPPVSPPVYSPPIYSISK